MNRLSEFGRFILDRTEWIGDRWNRVNGSYPELPLSGNTSRQQCADYLPALCRNLTRRFEKEGKTRRADRKRQKDALPQHRWRPGYNVEEIVRELSRVRQIISVDCLDAFVGDGSELDHSARAAAEAVIHEFFDELVVETVQQFAREKEDALAASEQNSQAILDSALDCIIVIGDDGRVREWNIAAERLSVIHGSGQSAGNWAT